MRVYEKVTWTIPASTCVSPTLLRVEFTQMCLHGGSKKHEKGPSWLRTCTFCHPWGLDQIHIENSGEKKMQLSLKAFPWDVLKPPRLGDLPLFPEFSEGSSEVNSKKEVLFQVLL